MKKAKAQCKLQKPKNRPGHKLQTRPSIGPKAHIEKILAYTRRRLANRFFELLGHVLSSSTPRDTCREDVASLPLLTITVIGDSTQEHRTTPELLSSV